MRALDPDLAHEQPTVLCVTRHGDRSLDRAAPSEPGPVVPQEPVAIDKGRFLHERLAPRGAHPQWIRTTGSPDPRSSYSSSRPSTAARSITFMTTSFSEEIDT